MCGISAFIGNFNGIAYAFDGIKVLQNRGYDSSGVCSINEDNQFICHKYATKQNQTAIDILENDVYKHTPGKIAQFHTRWSTTGGKTDINAHPHIDYTDRFSIVHNGIIENYASVKKDLIENYNAEFKSQTDTEVIVNLISIMYNKYNDVEEAIKQALLNLEGTWAFVLITTIHPNKMFCARHGSPLLIGFGDNFNIISSEQAGFCNYVNNYICLNDNDIVVLEQTNDTVIFNKKNYYNIREVTVGTIEKSPSPFPHWTIKEIHEQSDAVLRTLNYGSRLVEDKVRLGGFNRNEKDLRHIDNLILLGCGTSYNAGLYTSNVFKRISGFNSVQTFDGAEFSEFDIPKTNKTATIFISQSGETRDLIRCIDICKKHDLIMIGVINVVDSFIAREVHCGVYLNAGREVAVASTKAFTTQVTALYMIAVWFAQIRNINEHLRKVIINDIRRLPLDIKQVIGLNQQEIKQIANFLVDKNSMFILGKGTSEAIAKEGALKIKEIGYIHAEAYSSSALKHGPFSLLGPNTPVIIVTLDDDNILKNEAVCEEIVARDSLVIAITNTEISPKYNIKLNVPKNKTFSELLSVIPMQLIAYELALSKNTNPDQPKNLAKVITV
jgi:glucosamine--fructose-6-phosphate aminotransferase (isomerizing)